MVRPFSTKLPGIFENNQIITLYKCRVFVKSKNRKTENRYKFYIGRKRKMWQKLVTATISALLILVPLSNGLYFHIAETERKCFIEEIPDETMVTGTKKN